MALAFPLGPPLPLGSWPGWWPLGWVCLAPMMVASVLARSRARAFLWGMVAGTTAHTAILCWLHPFLVRWARLSSVEAAGVTALLILYVALYAGAFSLCVQVWAQRWGPSAALVLAPACWSALELARGSLLTGFPWCLLGYSQHPVLTPIQVADLTGIYGVSFLMASAGSLAAIHLTQLAGRRGLGRSRRIDRWAPWLLVACLALGLGYGVFRVATPAVQEQTGDQLSVALIQANVPQADKWDPIQQGRIEADHVAMTREAASRGASLIVWSETSVPISITHHPDYALRLEALATETGADLLVGTVIYGPPAASGSDPELESAPRNSAVLVRSQGGISGRYDKVHLVPFGEYVPMKRLLSFLEPLVHEASDFQSGEGTRILKGTRAPFSTLICYEAIFPDLTRSAAAMGAEMIVNITNDAWYGDTGMPRQHLAHAALRAVESRRYLLRCANTGISVIVAPSGRVEAFSSLGQKEILMGAVVPSDELTVYAASGDLFGIACVILAALSLAIAWRRTSTPEASARGGVHAGGFWNA